jgi:hypothetical protein
LETSTSKSINKAFDLFGFPVDALWCTSFQRLWTYFAFLLMPFDVLVSKSLWKPVHQRASTGKPNKSKDFGN